MPPTPAALLCAVQPVAVVVGAQQLEGLEARCRRDLAGAAGEAARELVEALARHGDGVDLDDAHADDPKATLPASANGGTRSMRSPLQKRPGSYQLAGRRFGSCTRGSPRWSARRRQVTWRRLRHCHVTWRGPRRR